MTSKLLAAARHAPALALLLAAAAGGRNPVSSETRSPVDAPEITPAPPPTSAAASADVRFTLDSRTTSPISPFIYGVNSYQRAWKGGAVPENLTLGRAGGNRWSAYNWENNASNAGSDWQYQNDGHFGGGDTPGEPVRTRVQETLARGAGILVTVPMLGYAAADKDGPVGTDEASLAKRLATRFREMRPKKGSAFTMRPDASDRYVYQDEFVWWLSQSFPGMIGDAKRPIMLSLDNEPDIWHETHAQVGRTPLGYDQLIDRTIAYAAAIKDVAPNAKIFGPALATYSGIATLGRKTGDPVAGGADFVDYYLQKMAAAERTHGRRLVDVLDVHWYSEIRINGGRVNDDAAPQTPELVRARMQAPRSLWDPTYDEKSWVNQVTGSPIRLLPRLREKIARFYPGTKLAITEYYYGRAGDISGGIAQADALGIFGREGVFAANLWPLARVDQYGGDGARAYAYAFGAFKMFRDYDGRRGTFGNTSIAATTSDVEATSVYASVDAGNPDRVVVVAINKTDRDLSAGVSLTHSKSLTVAEVYTMTDGAASPTRRADLRLQASNAFTYTMPPLSVTTLVLR